MKISRIFQNYITVVKNFLSLSIIQCLNYILPLITVPYLVRILGPDKYGITIFCTSFISYFQIATDYGFNLSATRNISINKNDNNRVNEIFNSVMIIKLFLCLIGFLILISIISIFNIFKANYEVYVVAYGAVIGNCLFPIWFFQGMEEMKYITYVNIIGKVFFTILIFIFIKSPGDYVKSVMLNSASYIIVGIISLFIVFYKFKLHIYKPRLKTLLIEFKEGWYVFTTSLLTSVLTTSGTFILGLFESSEIVGYYGAIDKIVKAIVNMYSPITQAIFPYISEKFKESYVMGKNEVLKISKIIMAPTLVLCLLLFILSKKIVLLFYGIEYISYSHILGYMSLWIFTSVLNNFIGVQYLIGSGNGKYYSKAFTISAIVTLIIYFSLIKVISYNSIILGSIIGEIVLTIAMIYYETKIRNERYKNESALSEC